MTYEEALSEIKKLFSHWLCIESKYRDDKEGEALVMAEQAIEKQIPKKAKDIYYPNSTVRKCTVCHICNGHISNEDIYCKNCGQALDWSE